MPRYLSGDTTIILTKEDEDWVVEVDLGTDHSQHWYLSRADFTLEDVLLEIETDFPDMKEG